MGNICLLWKFNFSLVKNTWMYSLGGDYRVTDELTLRAGVALDQTPTRNSTRDPRIPDGDRTFLSLGAGYDVKAIKGLSVDLAYSHQFVQEVKLQEARGDSSVIRITAPVAENALRPQDAAQFD